MFLPKGGAPAAQAQNVRLPEPFMRTYWRNVALVACGISAGFILTLAFTRAFAVDHHNSLVESCLGLLFLPHIILPAVVVDFVWPAARHELWSRVFVFFTFSLPASFLYTIGVIKLGGFLARRKRGPAA